MATGNSSTSLDDIDNWHIPRGMTMVDFLVGRKIGSGGCSEVRLAKQKSNGKICIVKLQRDYCSELAHEYSIYLRLGSGHQTECQTNIPRVLQFTKCGTEYDALVMDLMGLSLHDILFQCGGTFSLKTVLLIAKQILDGLEYVHSKNVLHKDVKPSNLVIGRRSYRTENIIYLIDFAFSEEFTDAVTNQHVPFVDNFIPRGTLEFMSLNVHKNRRTSRRDDLESVLYTLMYLLRGPECFYVERGECLVQKKEWLEMTINKDFPLEFGTFLKNVRELKFAEAPDYEYIKNIFQNLFNNQYYVDDSLFDWTGKNLPEINMSYEFRLKRNKKFSELWLLHF